jgi:manganese efflux pump family protein
MSFTEIILIAIGLAMDAAAVSLAAACCGFAAHPRAVFRLAFHFALFQFMMPILGWLIGSRFVAIISSYDHWVAFVVLVILGAKMIHSGWSHQSSSCMRDPSRGWELVILSLATSIDALAVGLSMAFLDVQIWYPAAVIGLVTLAMSVTAIKAGKYLGAMFGKKMEIVGGCVLIFVGLKILSEHL